ncbi:MAG: AAA family ATPase [Cyclobacteriaceae bacterium]
MSIKIAIVGPESTGKSTLSKQLALYFKTAWVPEYARDYLNKLGRPYKQSDLLLIAQEQIALEEKAAANHEMVFCDTNLLVIKIWSEFKYQSCHPWILKSIKERKYDLHLLTYIDLPWQDDPQREHPHAREQLFNLYKNELDKMKVSYETIKGENEERLLHAIAAVEKII